MIKAYAHLNPNCCNNQIQDENYDEFLVKLNETKNKVSCIRNELEDYFEELSKREKRHNDFSNKKINEILSNNTGKVTLNVSGVEFDISLNTLKSRRNTLFYKQILRGIIKPNVTVFYDRDVKHFPTILGFLRSGKVNLKGYSVEDKDELYNECEFYEVTYIIEVLKNTNNSFEFSNVKISKPFMYQGKLLGNSFLSTLNSKKLDKGFLSDKNGDIVIKLNKDIISNEVFLAGYNGNSVAWFVGNGIGCNIFIAKNETNINWEYIGVIPTDFGHEIKSLVFPKKTFRYIKFHHSDYFGIGYLDFKQVN
jgi:hypothetical protein